MSAHIDNGPYNFVVVPAPRNKQRISLLRIAFFLVTALCLLVSAFSWGRTPAFTDEPSSPHKARVYKRPFQHYTGTQDMPDSFPRPNGCRTYYAFPHQTEQEGQTDAIPCKPQETVPPQVCPAGTYTLFDVLGPIGVGTVTGAGGLVIDAKGDWSVELQDGTPMAHGRSITVQFSEPVYIDILIWDNDPKLGQSGWTINGTELPTTPRRSWAHTYQFPTAVDFITFERGDDSAHFNVCVW